MRLLVMGCEYSGKMTLARGISNWMIEAMGLRLVRWHNHFLVPRLDDHMVVHADGDVTAIGKEVPDLNTAEDEEQTEEAPVFVRLWCSGGRSMLEGRAKRDNLDGLDSWKPALTAERGSG